jgi:hypothetical protein
LSAAGTVTDAVGVLLSRGQAAVEAIAAAPDPTSRRDAEAFQQLQLIRQMVELAGQGQWDKVLQVRAGCWRCCYVLLVVICYCGFYAYMRAAGWPVRVGQSSAGELAATAGVGGWANAVLQADA